MSLIFWAIGLILVLAISFYLWPKDQRSFRMVATTSIIISATVGLGIVIARALPVTRKEIVEKVVQVKYQKPPQIIYRDKIVYREPGKEFTPVDVEKVCAGSQPVELLVIDVSTKGDDSTTWVIARPIGSLIKITCYLNDNLDSFWKVGDVVQFKNGKPQ